MVSVKAPEQYINEFGALEKCGDLIKKYGKRAFVIAGKRAYKAVGEKIWTSLDEVGIKYKLQFLEGYPTVENATAFAKEAESFAADVVIAIGGGKVCDTAKTTGDIAEIPVVTIPTIAATCASWATRSIFYTDEGNFDKTVWNRRGPVLVIADTGVILAAHPRYIAAGILDTMAKWYEFSPMIKNSPHDTVFRHAVSTADLANNILWEDVGKLVEGRATKEQQKEIVDAIIYLAGASGSFSAGIPCRGVAHAYYFASTRISESRYMLHGEKVAFGMLIQFVLENRSAGFIEDYRKLIKLLKMEVSPTAWGADRADERIAELMISEWPAVVENGFAKVGREVLFAMKQAEKILE